MLKEKRLAKELGYHTWRTFIGRRKNIGNRVFPQITKLVIRWFIYYQGCFTGTRKCVNMRLVFYYFTKFAIYFAYFKLSDRLYLL